MLLSTFVGRGSSLFLRACLDLLIGCMLWALLVVHLCVVSALRSSP